MQLPGPASLEELCCWGSPEIILLVDASVLEVTVLCFPSTLPQNNFCRADKPLLRGGEAPFRDSSLLEWFKALL